MIELFFNINMVSVMGKIYQDEPNPRPAKAGGPKTNTKV